MAVIFASVGSGGSTPPPSLLDKLKATGGKLVTFGRNVYKVYGIVATGKKVIEIQESDAPDRQKAAQIIGLLAPYVDYRITAIRKDEFEKLFEIDEAILKILDESPTKTKTKIFQLFVDP